MKIYTIYKIVAGSYTCVSEDGTEINIPAAGRLRYENITPLVGDKVKIDGTKIVQILERKNEFIRPKVANVDQMLVFMSIKDPEFQPFLVDKYLAIIEAKNIEPIFCFTKIDLDQAEAIKWKIYYQKMGYKVFLIDNSVPDNLNELKALFKNKYSVFMGQSGVGKTTTLNNLGKYSFETQNISKALGRGKHTTRVVMIVPFNDGYLIDTPGFSSLILDLDELELAQSYFSFKKLAPSCKYRSCLHQNESINDCAIKQHIGTDLIPELRYQNYLKLLLEVPEKRY
ncbi:ribosome small subunit-dependent GTPase A [Mycoplasma corogypsi]|uniref:ribosome small subunit-dependent GTPase A n=1 Tax=Mycoplasma corogypsi TaxID=2106 RepID=UPI003872DEAE